MAFNWIGKSTDGKTVTLHSLESSHFKFPTYFTPEWESKNKDSVRIGAAVDVETTGLDQQKDQIIEIGIRLFKFNRLTGEILSLDQDYSAFQDPGIPLSKEIVELTGITDEMLKGQKIDIPRVNTLLESAQIIVAHNAGFDRPFIDRLASVSTQKIWGCSFKQIDWESKGYPSQKLDILSIYHGFLTDSHRALNDADALLFLLSQKDSQTHAPYFIELMSNAKKPSITMMAVNSPFESKDALKGRNYRWDGQNRYWYKQIAKEQLESEMNWLKETVYAGVFRGRYSETQPIDQFKLEAQRS